MNPSAAAIVATLEELGYRFVVDTGAVAYDPPEVEPLEAARLLDHLRGSRAEVFALLAARLAPSPLPRLDGACLVIPTDAPPRYRWWEPQGQSVCQTLAELGAPAVAHRSYCSGCRPGQEVAL